MYLLKISKAWNDDGEIGLTVEQEILFSTEKKANDHLLNVSKNKGRCLSCQENNLMRVALIYKSCKDYPQHWAAALKALSLENKKVCIRTLAKLKAVA